MTAASNDAALNSRAEQRRKKLLAIEREQQQEELEALKMTEEQLHLLKLSFNSVKFEFHDLDGQRWTKSALYTRQYRAQTSWRATPLIADTVKTSSKNENKAYFLDETIRTPSRKASPSTLKCGGINTFESLFKTPTPSPTRDTFTYTTPKCNNRNGAKQRSPVKGLFQSVMRELDMNASWDASDGLQENASDTHYRLTCPPSPAFRSVGTFDNAPPGYLHQPQFAFTA